MDILVSSNLERLVYKLSGDDDKLTAAYMEQLQDTGKYEINGSIKEKLKEVFVGGRCSDEETKQEIHNVFQQHCYLMDTHTAVAYHVLETYRRNTGDNTPAVVVSTASPYKFCESVLSALGDEEKLNGLERIERLESVSGKPAPKPLVALKNKRVRFHETVDKEDLESVVRRFLV